MEAERAIHILIIIVAYMNMACRIHVTHMLYIIDTYMNMAYWLQ